MSNLKTLKDSGKRRENIRLKSKIFQNILCIRNWRYHSFAQEDSFAGVEAEPLAVFNNQKNIQGAYIDKLAHKIIVKMNNNTYYSTEESSLNEVYRAQANYIVSPKATEALNEAIKTSHYYNLRQ